MNKHGHVNGTMKKRNSAAAAMDAAPTRVACVRADDSPPPVWRMWMPSFCSLGFVREMRLR